MHSPSSAAYAQRPADSHAPTRSGFSDARRSADTEVMTRTYRSHPRLAVVCRVLAIASLVGWPLVAVLDACRGAACSRPQAFVAGLAAGALFAFFFWALARPLVIATDEGVVIRGYVRTFTLRWNEIDRFELRPHDTWTVVRLVDGSLHLVVALQTDLVTWMTHRTPRALPMVDDLNGALAERTGRQPAGRVTSAPASARPARSYGLLVALPLLCGVATGWISAASAGWQKGLLFGLLWLIPIAVNLTVVRRGMNRAGGYDLSE
jgi:hypothetical protein